MEKQDWPAWRYGPGGKEDVFENEGEVPAGWVDHPSKVKDATQVAAETGTAHQPANSTTTAAQAAKTTGEKATGTSPAAAARTKPSNSPNADDGKSVPNKDELDVAGWPWDPALHAGTKSKTKEGLWRLKVGCSRPAPKPGYPLDL